MVLSPALRERIAASRTNLEGTFSIKFIVAILPSLLHIIFPTWDRT